VSVPFLSTVFAPLLLRVEFRDAHWSISRAGAWGWVVAAVASDLLVQQVFGAPTWLTRLASLVTLLIGFLPPRLVHALAGLYVAQAAVSALLTWLMTAAGTPAGVTLFAGGMLALWCWAAMVLLVLRYIRTPKASFLS